MYKTFDIAAATNDNNDYDNDDYLYHTQLLIGSNVINRKSTFNLFIIE